ncbi:MAG TPA: DUF1990 domain-containing protein [Mycobacteriales bacterium]|jgi:uncharacterized protein (UPF0548 family)|nr:DUF1990 domain-containing protein [Mycobacteriales bacterium]
MLWWRGWSNNEAVQRRQRERTLGYLSELDGAPLNYDEPGMSDRTDVRRGYRRTLHRERLGNGEVSFHRVWAALHTGQMHRLAGLDVFPDPVTLVVDATFLTRLSFGPVDMVNPCRVIAVLDEPLRSGVTYGTLVGHVLKGEEQFSLELEPGGAVWLTIVAVSRPRAFYARLGSFLTRRAQSLFAKRYGRALQSAIRD